MLVSDVMLPMDRFPVLTEQVIVKLCLEEMGKFRLGIATIVDSRGFLLGVLTDGDLRRQLLTDQKPLAALFVDDVVDHMVQKPFTVKTTDSLKYGVDLMEKHQVWDLPVTDSNNLLVGLLHLHPAVQALLK